MCFSGNIKTLSKIIVKIGETKLSILQGAKLTLKACNDAFFFLWNDNLKPETGQLKE